MTPKEKRNALLAEKLVGNLKQRHYEAFFCPTAQEAVEKITGMIPEGDRKSTRLNSSHALLSRMPSSA